MGAVTPESSRTYKLSAPTIIGDHALYFTIVGGGTPTKMFINCKKVDDFQYLTPLMVAYTRQLKNGVPVDSVVHDMCETFDPRGSYFIPDGSGREVNSLIHHLGLVLRQHCADGPAL